MQQSLQFTNTITAEQIVIVENDLMFSQAIEQVLQSAGYGTCVFPSAEALIDCPDSIDADCFLISMDLPGMSGVELRKQLSVQGKQSPVVFMTTEQLSIHCDPLIKNRFLQKPFRGYRLISAIRNALNIE